VHYSQFPCHIVPPRPTYLPQHHTFEHLQPMFLHCGAQNFTSIQNNTIIKTSLYLNIYNFCFKT
jgi:hypothetical protein